MGRQTNDVKAIIPIQCVNLLSQVTQKCPNYYEGLLDTAGRTGCYTPFLLLTWSSPPSSCFSLSKSFLNLLFSFLSLDTSSSSPINKERNYVFQQHHLSFSTYVMLDLMNFWVICTKHENYSIWLLYKTRMCI